MLEFIEGFINITFVLTRLIEEELQCRMSVQESLISDLGFSNTIESVSSFCFLVKIKKAEEWRGPTDTTLSL